MLSILIPVYNYNITPLINEIHKQVISCDIDFEILIFDDGSNKYVKENSTINTLSFSEYRKLSNNIGRSAIRNLLASNATYDSLLFIDAGTYPASTNFIETYIKQLHHPVVTGGMTNQKERAKKPYTLRWLYTKKRESISPEKNKTKPVVCSSNFLINKEIFTNIKFDESLKKYGCEDVLFFDTIIKKMIPIKYLHNPVIHDANDDAASFIKKTEHAIENLIELINTGKLQRNRYKVSDLYYRLNKIKMDKVVSLIFRISRNLLKRNFHSSHPSILCYDFYRLGYFCLTKNRK